MYMYMYIRISCVHVHVHVCHPIILLVSYRTGCKPFVEVFQDGERMFTSASQDTMQHIQSFTAEHGGVVVPLGTKVRGNIQVIIHHIRAIPIARKANLVSEYCCLLLFAACFLLCL